MLRQLQVTQANLLQLSSLVACARTAGQGLNLATPGFTSAGRALLAAVQVERLQLQAAQRQQHLVRHARRKLQLQARERAAQPRLFGQEAQRRAWPLAVAEVERAPEGCVVQQAPPQDAPLLQKTCVYSN